MALFFVVITRRHAHARRTPRSGGAAPGAGFRSPSRSLLLTLAVRVYLGRFERLFEDHTIFAGVTYTEAHVTLTGHAVRQPGALVARRAHRAGQRGRGAAASAGWWLAVGAGGGLLRHRRHRSAGTSRSFIVKPNELVRESPYITHNIEMTRQAYGLDRFEQRPFPGRERHRGARSGEQPGDAEEHPAVGLARAAGHAAPDPGDPHLLRLPRHRHRSLRDRRRRAADDARGARAEHRAAAGEQPQLDQREADLHPRLRRDDEPGQRLHAGRPARADPEGHAGAEHDPGHHA